MAFIRNVLHNINFTQNVSDKLRVTLSLSGLIQQTRSNTSFFNKLPAEALWKGVTSVSNAGKKRGRGKGAGRKMIRDLNKGQVIGVGKINMVWPGLTTHVIRGKELITQQQLPEDPDREAKLIKIRNEMGTFRRIKLASIDRGWSGTKLSGRSVGPPSPIGDDLFEGFDTIVIESKTVFNMTGTLGRKRRSSIFVVTGNKEGLVGFGLGKAVDQKSALANAKNRAGQRLLYVERYNSHTVCHDFFTQFSKTKIYVKKKPEGYGLVCHRAIKNICQLVGIKDIHAKIEGSTNLQNIVKAFFLGLLQQKTPERLAEETSLLLVESKKEHDSFPTLVASPSTPVKETDKCPKFDEYIMDGKVQLKRDRSYEKLNNSHQWIIHLKKNLKYRNRVDVTTKLALSQKYIPDPHAGVMKGVAALPAPPNDNKE